MDHHHEEYDVPEDLLSKLKDYWKEPNVFNFNTKIKEIDKDWMTLKKNYFYPEGGGQPPDMGFIIPDQDKSKRIKVIDVQSKDGDTWLYLKNHDLLAGDGITGLIDENRRQSLSRNHSAQHLISAVFWEELNLETSRADIRMEESQVEFNKPPSLDDIEVVNQKINDLISDNLPIYSRYYKNASEINKDFRGSTGNLDVFRLVAIGDYDLNPCGGTHVTNTKSINSIFINKIESKKIRFVSGNEAKALYVANSINLIKLSRLTSVPISKLPVAVEEIIVKKDLYEKKLHKLESQLLETKYKLEPFVQIGNHVIKMLQVPRIIKGKIMDLTNDLTQNDLVILVDEDGVFILSGGNDKIVTKLMSQLRDIGIKGGGKGKFVMGKTRDLSFKKLKNKIHEILRQTSHNS